MSFVNIGSKKKHLLVPTQSYVYKHRYFLHRLLNIVRKVANGEQSPERLYLFIRKASPLEIKALVEVCRNVLQKKHPETSVGFIKKIIPFKDLIRRLACGKTPLQSKRKALTTQVGGLPFLIPLLAPIVSTLISAGIQAAI